MKQVCINNLHKISYYNCICTAPSVPPENLMSVGITATSIMFQWDELTGPNVNGRVRNYTISCLSPNNMTTEVSLTKDNIMSHSGRKSIRQRIIMYHAKSYPRR